MALHFSVLVAAMVHFILCHGSVERFGPIRDTIKSTIEATEIEKKINKVKYD